MCLNGLALKERGLKNDIAKNRKGARNENQCYYQYTDRAERGIGNFGWRHPIVVGRHKEKNHCN